MKLLNYVSIGIVMLGYVAVLIYAPFLNGDYFPFYGMTEYQVGTVLRYIVWFAPLISLILSTSTFVYFRKKKQVLESTYISFILLLLYVPFIFLDFIVNAVFFDGPLT